MLLSSRTLVASLVAAFALCVGTGCDVDDSTSVEDATVEESDSFGEALVSDETAATAPVDQTRNLNRVQAAARGGDVELIEGNPASAGPGSAKGGFGISASQSATNQPDVGMADFLLEGDISGDRTQNPAAAGANKSEPEPDPWNPGEPEPDPWHPRDDR